MGVVDLEVLIVVKSYPNPSQALGEATCVVGICRDRGFVRLYPVPFRKLEDEQQFSKYQVIRLKAQEPRTDKRPGTFRPILDSIELVDEPLSTGIKRDWAARKEWVMPWVNESMCQIQRQQKTDATSMGFFKPAEVLDITQEEQSEDWNPAELTKLEQTDFFMTKENTLLEKIPYKWRYVYRCSDPKCNGHEQQIIDWEAGAFYRNVIRRSGITAAEDIREGMRRKFLGQLCGVDRDTHFFTGNMAAHQGSFLILGVFWPPVDPQGQLF
jgi:hypothetical protein